MPSIVKRRNDSDGDDHDDDDGAEASTSNISQAQFKRLKVNANGNGHHQSRRSKDDVEDEEESHGEENQEQTAEEDELDGEEMEMAEESTQGPVGEAEIGVIEKVSLTNFMCHDRLEVNLGPKLNFIIGNNGSGKSAILTGITIALGGKATATSRGNSLKAFVKEGKQTAMVEVTLKNTGEEAYKPKEYKNKIIVERTIRTDGSGSWKIKSEDRRIISTKREELNAICDHANIQVDNPMNILTQDSARQFLSASHSGEKYDYFLKGTQLAQLAAEYDLIKENIDKIKTSVTHKEGSLPMLREKAQEANQLLEVVQKAADQKKHISSLREQLVWASVAEQEIELEALMERIERLVIRRRKLEEKRAISFQQQETFETTITELEKRATANAGRELPLVAEIKETKDKERIHINVIKDRREEENSLNEQFIRTKAQLESLNARIEAESRKLHDGNEEKRSAVFKQQRQAELERKKLERDEAEQRDRLTELDREIIQIDRDASKLQGKQDQLRNEVTSSEAMMKTLRVTQSSRLTAYGHNIPALLSAIDREARWRERPIGPIGNHLKLRETKWANVLESVMGNTLNAFCVTNIHDRNLLQDLKRRCKCDDIPILTGSDEAFDFSAGEPQGDVLTILRVLDIQTPFLIRQLINSMHIEQSALVEKRVEGDALMRQGNRNVKTCFSMDMYRLSGGRVGSSTVTLQPYRGVPRLTTDIGAKLAQLEEKHRKDDEELRDVSRSLGQFLDQKRELNEERIQIRQRIPVLQRRARERHAEMERLDEELREDEPTNIQALVEARNDLDTEQVKIGVETQKVHERIADEEMLLKPLVDERQARRRQLAEIQEQSQSLKPQLEEAAHERLKAHNSWMHWGKELAKIQPLEEGLESSCAMCEKELERRTAAAEGHCDKVQVEKSVKWLEKQIDVAEQQLQMAAKRHGVSIEAITMQVKQYSDAFMKAQVEIQALKEVLKELNAALAIRTDKWRLFRRMIAVRAKNMFNQFLSRRGFSGSLKFDHQKGKLELTVKTEEATNGHQDKDPKSLSGGEKSFATICLLLSLWESIGCPIRCLDEFDVFMDAVNRKISMNMMVEAAKGPHGIQYILITPLGMAGIAVDNDVRAIQLTEPERNQGTLQFTSVTA